MSDWAKTWGTSAFTMTHEATLVHDSAVVEEGLLDLIERGSAGLQIANEATERIGQLQEQMTARVTEKTAQLEALSRLPRL